jgi:hypothetical protein
MKCFDGGEQPVHQEEEMSDQPVKAGGRSRISRWQQPNAPLD